MYRQTNHLEILVQGELLPISANRPQNTKNPKLIRKTSHLPRQLRKLGPLPSYDPLAERILLRDSTLRLVLQNLLPSLLHPAAHWQVIQDLIGLLEL